MRKRDGRCMLAKWYESYVEGRVLELAIKAGRKALNEEWKMIRRGWWEGTGFGAVC